MTIIKCKMCGGDLSLAEGSSTAKCEFCGSVQTIPNLDDEKKLIQFERAERLRKQCEFDKAAGIYETIVADFRQEAEAYWGLVLCKFGIEYVDDPASGKKIPTCHRSSFDSILDDSDFEQALENADPAARKVYREEAKQIEEIRKGIIAVSNNEQPYDIFICYKETGENGDRTLDSVLAQDIYDALTCKGYRVFFARITLEDKLGMEYEPYIFAALNSAKIMLAVGTDYEYFNAVWVKNEWSRYLKLMAKDKDKHLIPCFKGIDAYDMPREFARLQAQDLGKVGAMQDLLRGIDKILPRQQQNTTVIQERVVVGGGGSNKIASLLDRGNMALEDGDWAKADSFFEDVLNNDSKNAQAYLGKTLAQEKCRTIDAFVRKRKELSQQETGERLHIQPASAHIDQIIEQYSIPGYVSEKTIRELYRFDLSYQTSVPCRKQQYRKEEIYWAEHKLLSKAEKFAVGAVAENLQREKKALFAALSERVKKAEAAEAAAKANVQQRYDTFVAQADQKAAKLCEDRQNIRQIYYEALLQTAKTATDVKILTEAAQQFAQLGDYLDSKNLAEHCRKRAKEEQAKIDEEAERQRVLKKKQAKEQQARKKRIAILVTAVSVLLIAAVLFVTKFLIPNSQYVAAESLLAEGKYQDASHAFTMLDTFRNSEQMVKAISCIDLLEDGQYEIAVSQMLENGVKVSARYEKAGKGDTETADYTSEKAFSGLLEPTFEGYRFVKWDLSEWKYQIGGTFVLEFQATWTDDYIIEYELAGGTAENPVEYHKDGAAVTLNRPTRTGYTFLGWTGTGLDEMTLDVTIPAGSFGDKKFTANWQPNQYTITLDTQGGSIERNTITVAFDANITLPIPSREKYAFTGWFIGDTQITDGVWTRTEDVTLTARWEASKYKINYHLDGGKNSENNPSSFTTDSPEITLSAPTKAGYKFLGWYSDSNYDTRITKIDPTIGEDVNLYAKWEIIHYTIRYHLNGGSNASANPSNYTVQDQIALQDPTRTGYTFVGWYSDSNFSKKVTAINKGSYGDANLYAKWEAIRYTITYNLNGGSNASSNPNSYTIDNQIKLQDPTRTGYKFMGWYSDGGFSNKVTQIAKGSQADVTLYAKWEIITYTITYNLNGGTISGTQKTTFTVNDLPFALPGANKTNYVFLYWALDGMPITEVTSPGDITIVACFMDPLIQMQLSSDGKSYGIKSYTGSATHVDIPAYYKGLPVISINDGAFEKCKSLKSIIIPNTVKTICYEAFCYCESLESIVLPDSVTVIEAYAFQHCKSLKEIDLPNSLKELGSASGWAFYGCTSLTSITIPDSVTWLGSLTFSGCINLKTVKLSENLTRLGYGLFDDCVSLTSIIIPEKVKVIDANVFNGCTSLTKIIIPEGVTSMAKAFAGCSNLTIYCRTPMILEHWVSNWNCSRPVVWGYTGN